MIFSDLICSIFIFFIRNNLLDLLEIDLLENSCQRKSGRHVLGAVKHAGNV